MSFNEEFHNLLSETEQFLQQQQELYGDTFFLSQEEPIDGHQNPMKTPRKQASATTETELFGTELLPNTMANKVKEPTVQPYPSEPWTQTQSLVELDEKINKCLKCSLSRTRKKFVFGVGNPKAELVIVGEAPGADEDEQGEPFVGRAGQLLNKILEAIQFKRESVYICNILKCRPPNNRDPQTEEIDCCEPYLWKQLELIKPKLILCAGRISGQSLLKTNSSLAQLRGKIHDYRGIPLMVTYHPAALLRNPNWKRPCWEDMQMLRKLYDEMKGKSTP